MKEEYHQVTYIYKTSLHTRTRGRRVGVGGLHRERESERDGGVPLTSRIRKHVEVDEV